MIATAMTVEDRCAEVTQMLIEALGLDDIDAAEVNYDAPLFASMDDDEEGIGLDSVDALEIIVMLRNNYGIRMKDEDKKALRSVRSIAEFVETHMGDEE
ncbi:MAG: phosphopantetheine-binding protein [Bilifractor sp.]|jgi:acyl carrier protein